MAVNYTTNTLVTPEQMVAALAGRPVLGDFLMQPTVCTDVVMDDTANFQDVNRALYCGYSQVRPPARSPSNLHYPWHAAPLRGGGGGGGVLYCGCSQVRPPAPSLCDCWADPAASVYVPFTALPPPPSVALCACTGHVPA